MEKFKIYIIKNNYLYILLKYLNLLIILYKK